MAMTMEVEGLKEILDKLDAVAPGKWTRTAMKALGDSVQERAMVYAPELPIILGRSWWKRGEGSRYYRLDGSFSRGRTLSQNLKRSWKVDPGDREVTIHNAATYGVFVQGDRQTGVHAMHGWKRLDVIAREMMPELLEALRRWVDRILGNA